MTVSPRQSGFSMLEVLICIVILSIGALGAAGMQVSALKDTGSANNRFRAASLATAMADSLRADRTQAVKGGADFTSSVATGSCSAVAVQPVKRWQNQIACELPGGKGGVDIDSYWKRAIITVEWNDSRGTQGQMAQQFRLETRL